MIPIQPTARSPNASSTVLSNVGDVFRSFAEFR